MVDLIEKELKNLTIEEFMNIGKLKCNKSIYDHSPCNNINCRFHGSWACDVYDLLSHVQEEEFDKKYIVSRKPGESDTTDTDINKILSDRQKDLHLQYVNYCEEIFQLQHQCIRNLIGLDNKPMSKKDKAEVQRKNLKKWSENNDQIGE